jgi:acetyl esterase/lipase
MRTFFLSLSLFLLVVALVYHYAALKLFNTLISKDAQTELVAEAVDYGPQERQQLDLYRPSNAKAPLPILLFVHGGSWRDGDRSGYEFIGRTFAARGYLTLVMNYRLLPEHPFPDFVLDVAMALNWAGREGQRHGGDPRRIFAVGHSAGGYNVAMAILAKNYLDLAGVDSRSLRGVATLAGPFDFLPLDTKATKDAFGKTADLATTQPINYARGDVPPFLLMTGTADTTVFPRNSRALEKKLRDVGATVELREYKGIGHVGILLALAKPFRSAATPVLDDILAFFAQHDEQTKNMSSMAFGTK